LYSNSLRMKRLLCLAATMLIGWISTLAQNVTLTGTAKNASNNENISAVSVTVKDTDFGTFTNDKGSFRLSLPPTVKFPLVLVFSSIGFEFKEVTVNSASEVVNVSLAPASSLGQEVVVSATRTPARILESPVTIERVSNASIRNSAVSNYYDIVSNLKGVDVISASLTFASPVTRGFGGSGNARFTQIMNGMDNQAPGLNFSVGSIIGLTELDVDNMELLPGASSALYGSGGMNGTLLINGKNPFKYQGLSAQVKTGIMHVGDDAQRDAAPYYNLGFRWAKKLGDRFAFKIAAEMIKAEDWVAADYRNYKRLGAQGQVIPGERFSDPNYDGINVYGDETTVNLRSVLNIIGQQAPFLQGYISTLPQDISVSRTGYTEKEVADPTTLNVKLTGAVHYRFAGGVEASLSGAYGTGNTLYTGSERYSLKDFKIGQYKLEFVGKSWMARAYTTQENAGEAHNMTVTMRLLNEAWKPSTTWYPIYAVSYLTGKLSGLDDRTAHNSARSNADLGRPEAGSAEFKRLYDSVRLVPIPKGGLFLDRSDLYVVEGQYNLSEAIKIVEVLVGGNWKKYVLNSQGTLFPDKPGEPISISEYGAYLQLSKDIIKDRLRLTASGRYDKNENFDGRFTPRFTALIKPAKDHNIRLSFQTAYRFPTTQQQWIDLDLGSGNRLLGGVKELWDKYHMTENPVYDAAYLDGGPLVVVPYTQFKPESVVSYEVGYKSLIQNKLLIDANIYFSQYEDFLSRRDVVQKKDPSGPDSDLLDVSKRNGYSIVVNSPGKVKAWGWGFGLEYLLPNNFSIGGNISSDELNDVPEGFDAAFNSPKYRTNVMFANSGFGPGKKFGFRINWRWQDGFVYESDFADGEIPAFHCMDAQVNYKFPEIKSMIKIGATNLLNQYYTNSLGNPFIGGLYYVSFGYNIF
jgi:outer membrane receptor protein involved in Fe transport